MSNRRRKTLDRHLSEPELDEVLAGADDGRLLRRLVFVKNLYRGDTVKEAAERVGRSESTGDRWADRWNEGGLAGLPPSVGGGRPPKLDEEEREALLERLRADQPWTPRAIRRLLDEEFGVEYHPSYLSDLLRRLGLSYSVSDAEQPRSDSEPSETHEGRSTGRWRFDETDRR